MGRGDSMATSKPGWMFTRSRLRLIGTSLGGTDHRPIQQPQVMMMMMMMMGLRRAMSTAAAEVGVKEESMRRVLIKALDATKVTVEDISGGCGAMYKIAVESPQFQGQSLVKQHKMVKTALKSEIAEMHGLTLQTKAS